MSAKKLKNSISNIIIPLILLLVLLFIVSIKNPEGYQALKEAFITLKKFWSIAAIFILIALIGWKTKER